MQLLRIAFCLVAVAATPSVARGDLLAEVRSRGVLRVGMAEYAPWMTLALGGKPTGLEVEIVERLAGDLGVRLQVVVTPFDALVDRVAARDVDMVASNLSITPERALKVAFSEPYGESEVHAVARTDLLGGDVSLEQLNNESTTIATTAGTTAAQTAAEQFPSAQITEFATHDDAAKALLDGEAKALVGSTPYPELLAASDERLAIVGDQPLRTTVEAFAVPQGEQIFLTFLDNWIDAVTAEGFIEATRHNWYDQEDAVQPAAPPL
ncbi:MAG: transporter substrate-binding domain-containing protein [Geminicoccaceae bacterium]